MASGFITYPKSWSPKFKKINFKSNNLLKLSLLQLNYTLEF